MESKYNNIVLNRGKTFVFDREKGIKMSAKEEVQNSLDREDAIYDNFLAYVKQINELVPSIQRRKREVKVKREFYKNAPDDIGEEFAGTIINIQTEDERRAGIYYPQTSDLTGEAIKFMSSGSGTTNAYESFVENFAHYETDSDVPNWIPPIRKAITTLAIYELRRELIPKKLSAIHNELGKMFLVAVDSVEKARGGVITVDQATNHLREVHQHTWGMLVKFVRSKRPRETRGMSSIELSRVTHRQFMAESLTKKSEDRDKLSSLLGNMYNTYSNLSETNFGKNPLNKDIEKLSTLFTGWVIQLSELVDLVDLS